MDVDHSALPTKARDLLQLQGQPLGSYQLEIPLKGKSRFGAQYFQISLRNQEGYLSEEPLLVGLFNTGIYPSHHWIEIIGFFPQVQFTGGTPRQANLIGEHLEEPLFQMLCNLIPPGGHFMAEYESPERRFTDQSLILGIPAVATPLGYLLFCAGCGMSFKDWYISEGGMEGPRKLQGYKALNREQAVDRGRKMIAELESFLAKPAGTWPRDYQESAHAIAPKVIAALRERYPELASAS